eukprot:2661251-Rhodomonas_salina.3
MFGPSKLCILTRTWTWCCQAHASAPAWARHRPACGCDHHDQRLIISLRESSEVRSSSTAPKGEQCKARAGGTRGCVGCMYCSSLKECVNVSVNRRSLFEVGMFDVPVCLLCPPRSES